MSSLKIEGSKDCLISFTRFTKDQTLKKTSKNMVSFDILRNFLISISGETYRSWDEFVDNFSKKSLKSLPHNRKSLQLIKFYYYKYQQKWFE